VGGQPSRGFESHPLRHKRLKYAIFQHFYRRTNSQTNRRQEGGIRPCIPVLDASQIDTAKRFASGPAHDFAPSEMVYGVGERNVPARLVLKGSIDVVRRDGLNHEAAITRPGPGQFSGEVSQLAGAGTLASARAGLEGCTALPFDAAHVRALMIGSAEVGEIMMRAFILRRACCLSPWLGLSARWWANTGIRVGPRSKAQAVGSLGDTSGASAVLELMQEARSRWTLTGLLSAWGADPVTIREAFPATGVDSTRDRIGCSWPRLDPIAPRNYRDYSPHKILSALCLGLALGRCSRLQALGPRPGRE
jgi:hypothetical protein